MLDIPPVFRDSLALRMVRPEAAAEIRDNPGAYDRSPISRYLRAFLAVRSRIAEEQVAEGVAEAVSQYVVLGAGFDTFAYRNPYSTLRVYEVDHPATQAVKIQRLAAAGIEVPSSVTHVAVDLSRTSLHEALTAAGFNEAKAAVFSWLGVVPYLERNAIENVLHYVASLPAGTRIVFDYGVSPSSLGVVARLVFDRMAARVAAIGEPWKTFFAPQDLFALLRSMGFSVEDHGAEELNTRYFAGRSDGLQVGSAGRIVKAIVKDHTA